jgi:hypothetical protein
MPNRHISDKKAMGLIIAIILISFGALALSDEQADPYKKIGSTLGYGTRVQYYEVPEGYPKFEVRTRFIGNLRGTWHEMGIQYGKASGDLIRYAADSLWMDLSEEYGPEHLKEDIDRYAKAIDDYAPRMTQFLKGIATGASEELAQSPYKAEWSDFQMIILINCFPSLDWMHPPLEYHKGKTTPIPKKRSMQVSPIMEEIALACTGMALSGKSKLTPHGFLLSATKNGETIITQNMDVGTFYPWGWNVSYVATPSDPEANVFWSISTAGMAGGNNMIVNEKGLALGLYAGGWKGERPEDFSDPHDFGVNWQPLFVYTIAYADNVGEAIELLTLGSSEYRTKTGSKIVMHAGKWGYMVADPDEVAMVEVTSHRYAIRHPGDMKEAGNYVVYGNWNGSKFYFDENNLRREVPPRLKPLSERTMARYYAFDWHLRYHLGEVDITMAQEMTGMTWLYDRKTGRRLDFAEDGIPIYLKQGTPCNFRNLNKGGTMWSSSAILRRNGKSQIWWTKGRPCEWLGPWDHIDFAGFIR